jgi:hypothetical protein
MRRKTLSLLIAIASLAGLGMNVRADEAEVKAAADRIKDTKLKDHLMTNIDIFGKNDLPAIYILMPGADGDEDIKGSIITRDFSRDPFFMQNVDREEFELKVVLREVGGEDGDKKKDDGSR